MTMVSQGYPLIPSTDIDDQRIKKSKMDHLAHLASPNQKLESHMLPSLHEYFHAENLRYKLITSKYIDDQRILQSDWTRTKPGQTQSKVAVSDATFP